jgi:hypothetical protein
MGSQRTLLILIVGTAAVIAGVAIYHIYRQSVVIEPPVVLHGTWCYRDFDYQPRTRELVHSPDSTSHCHILNPHDIHERVIFHPRGTIDRWHNENPGLSSFWVDKCKAHSVTLKDSTYELSVSCTLSPERRSTDEKWKMEARPDGTGLIEYGPLWPTAPFKKR